MLTLVIDLLQNSLRTLMERMSASEPVFVRCIKPNHKQQADLFDDECVHTQVSSNVCQR